MYDKPLCLFYTPFMESANAKLNTIRFSHPLNVKTAQYFEQYFVSHVKKRMM